LTSKNKCKINSIENRKYLSNTTLCRRHSRPKISWIVGGEKSIIESLYFQLFSVYILELNQLNNFLQVFPIGFIKMIEVLAVNIEHCDYFGISNDRYNYF